VTGPEHPGPGGTDPGDMVRVRSVPPAPAAPSAPAGTSAPAAPATPAAVPAERKGSDGAPVAAAWSAETAMRRALELAAGAVHSGDVPVGAVVLDGVGLPVAEAANQRELDGDPTAHAEVLALRRAAEALGSWRLADCTLVVTLEPCTMCAGALVLARVSRLVYGAVDRKAGAVGSLWDVVRDRRLNWRPEVRGGVLEAECGALLREFFAAHRDRPEPPADPPITLVL